MVAVDDMNAIGNLHGSDDEILHSDGNLHDYDDNLHDDGKNVRESVNDDEFSHNDDENEERDRTVSDGDDGIHSVRICNDCHGSGDQRTNGGDKSNDQGDDDDSQDHRFRGKCF